MTTLQWLVFFHVAGAFLFVSGAVAAGVLQIAALRAERPSQIALLFKLVRLAVPAVSAGAIVSLALGIWLVVHVDGYTIGEGWIVGALALWVASLALGGIGGRHARHTRYLAEQLAAQGDSRTEDFDRRLHAPLAHATNYASTLAAIAILILMVWKPGA